MGLVAEGPELGKNGLWPVKLTDIWQVALDHLWFTHRHPRLRIPKLAVHGHHQLRVLDISHSITAQRYNVRIAASLTQQQ